MKKKWKKFGSIKKSLYLCTVKQNKQQFKTITIMKTTVIIRRHIRQVYSLRGNKYEYFWKIECSKDIRWVAPNGEVTNQSLAGEYRTLTAAKNACERAGVDFEYFKK